MTGCGLSFVQEALPQRRIKMSERAKGHRLRRGRFSETGRAYHVTTTTHDRTPLFRDWRVGRLVAHSLRHLQNQGRAETLAFVVMPDHLHWLLVLGNAPSLSVLMHSLKGFSGKQVRQALDSSGPIWQRGFHDHALRRDEDVRVVARYIVANPLRAGLVADIGHYPLWDAAWLL